MTDLARRRNARDLWISRSHLMALGVGALVLCATTFALGVSVSQGSGGAQVPASLLSEVPDDRLVELLARVEASEDPLGGIASLTFPADLSRVPEPILPMGPPLPAGVPAVTVVEPLAPSVPPPIVHIEGAAPSFAALADTVPSGSFTAKVAQFDGPSGASRAVALRARLRAAGLEAWVSTRLQSGVPLYRVAVGGYPDAVTAASVSATILEVEPDLQVEIEATTP